MGTVCDAGFRGPRVVANRVEVFGRMHTEQILKRRGRDGFDVHGLGCLSADYRRRPPKLIHGKWMLGGQGEEKIWMIKTAHRRASC